MDLRRLASLFYVVQFDPNLDNAIDRIVERMSSGGAAGFTRDELLTLLDAALISEEALAHFDMSEFNRTEEEVRAFLKSLRVRLGTNNPN